MYIYLLGGRYRASWQVDSREVYTDLMLAAEIGKSLLENNIKLKTSYEDLLQRSHRVDGSPLPTPSTSLVTNEENDSGIDDDDHDEDDDDDDDGMRFVPSHRTREAMIEVLERKNSELSKRLEMAISEHENAGRANIKKTRKLEAEIEALKSNLEIATTKIQELEEMNQRQRRMEASQAATNTHLSQEAEDPMVEELLLKIEQLETSNTTVAQTKAELESKLGTTLIDLRRLKQQFEQFQFTQSDYETLQEAYERQFRHIAELNESLEEHRGVLQKLKERGVNIYSPKSTPVPSECGGDLGNGRDGGYHRHTLLGELESEWLKQKREEDDDQPSRIFFSPSASSVSHFTEKSLAAFHNMPNDFEAVLAKASGIDPQLLDEALGFINKLEEEHSDDKCLDLAEYDFQRANGDNVDDDEAFEEGPYAFDIFPCCDLYPRASPVSFQLQQITDAPKSFLGRIRRLVRQFFRAVWRWCRFAVILTTAVLISVWKGPKDLLIEY